MSKNGVHKKILQDFYFYDNCNFSDLLFVYDLSIKKNKGNMIGC